MLVRVGSGNEPSSSVKGGELIDEGLCPMELAGWLVS